MDSTTARQWSAFFPAELVSPELREVFDLAARLADPKQRTEAARSLARRAGADEMMIFVPDAEVGALLPAPGFPQTLPDFRRWSRFLANLRQDTPQKQLLPYPTASSDTDALAVQAVGGSVLVLLGGNPLPQAASAVAVVLPVLAAAFQSEQALAAAEGKAAVAREAAGEAKLLTASLENARRALQEALAKAEAANSAKDKFLAILSHELRTPLAPVLTTATVLLADQALPASLREPLEMIQRNVELEARLIDDLLDLTRIAKGKMPLSLEVLDAHSLISQTLKICQSDIYRKELRIQLELNATEYHVHADPVRLQQVLWNLLKNAIKFTPTGGHLRIKTGNERGELCIDVTDSGIGIEPHHLERIFTAFEQAEETIAKRFGGLGLGLAISKALVEGHGGRLVASSKGKGHGATFSVSLATAPRPVAARVASAPDEEPSAKPLKLLLVEDHADTAAIMARLLRQFGHNVFVAHSIAAGLRLAEQQNFDLVISDLGLPDGSGLEMMRSLRARHGLGGVAISGYGMEEDLAKSREAGFFAHLTKPVNLQQVQAILRQFSEKKALERAATEETGSIV